MCFSVPTPKPVIVDPGQKASNAAADAVVARRRNAQGFSASLGGGMNASDQPSIARALLLGGS